MLEHDPFHTPLYEHNEPIFTQNNLLTRKCVESLSEMVTKTWTTLNAKDSSGKNIARKSITDFIQTLCRKSVLRDHDCWTSNTQVVSTFIHRIVQKEFKTQTEIEHWKNELDMFSKNADGKFITGNSKTIYQSLKEAQHLPFSYAALNLPVESHDLCRIIHKHLHFYKLNEDTDFKKYVADVFRKKDELKLPIFLVEQILQAIPDVIEKTFIQFASKLAKGSCSMKENYDKNQTNCAELNAIIELSSKSSVCFNMCTEILHTLFIYTDCSEVIFELIQMFISRLRGILGTSKLVLLYPEEYQNIVFQMQMSVNSRNTKILLELFEKLKKEENGTTALMLLSHNPHWFPVLQNNIRIPLS